MFYSYYGMEFNPFDKEIDTKYAFETEDFKIVKNRLEFLKEHPSLALFTGRAGLGKTFCIRTFLDSLNPSLYKCVYISMSTVTVIDFYRQLLIGLGVEPERKKCDMFNQIQETIINYVKNKKIKVIICLDEAQYLKTDIINDLKILLNFEIDSKNYLTLILVGQPVLNNILNHNVHEALRQRITVSYNLSGISKDEMIEYINNMLSFAKGRKDIFTPQALETLYTSCDSSLRVVNNIISKSMIIASKNEKNVIDSDIILEAYNDIQLG